MCWPTLQLWIVHSLSLAVMLEKCWYSSKTLVHLIPLWALFLSPFDILNVEKDIGQQFSPAFVKAMAEASYHFAGKLHRVSLIKVSLLWYLRECSVSLAIIFFKVVWLKGEIPFYYKSLIFIHFEHPKFTFLFYFLSLLRSRCSF